MVVLRSETVCYLVMVLNHMVSASCLTLVLPVLVFLWAMLSVPRPSKTFWMTAIIYTEVRTGVDVGGGLDWNESGLGPPRTGLRLDWADLLSSWTYPLPHLSLLT